MKYFWLSAKDQRQNNWLFYHESNDTGIRLREEYLSLQCPKCKKIDELAALELGISPEVKIRSKSDHLRSDDGITCVSTAGRRVLEEANIEEIRFVALPGDPKYSLLLPNSFIPTVREQTLMEFLRPCPACDRSRETCGFPVLASMQLPSEGKVLGCPSVALENTGGRNYWFLASQEVVALLRENKLTGVDYYPA